MIVKFGSTITFLSVIAILIYLGNTFHSLYNLFHPEVCVPTKTARECIYPLVDKRTGKWPLHGLHIRVSPTSDPFAADSVGVYQNKDFDLYKEFDVEVVLKLNDKLKKNINKVLLHAVLLPSDQRNRSPSSVEERLLQSSKLTVFKVPEAATFNLVSDEKKEKEKSTKTPHLRSKVFLAAVEDSLVLPLSNLPHEIVRFLKMERIDDKHQYYPIFTVDEMSSRLKDQVEVRLNYYIMILLYIPHKSWYSWIINCLSKGVYAFGFLFMLPQLFLNYKLKSVAHLPWRAFMYKAFNTFIDDMFAFIISMPTAHRVACFRDDIVFLIYLYQRYLYPVDKKRVNEFGQAFEDEDQEQERKESKKVQ
ncbi:hypothetical protein FO519_009158 [Halicephalobus sp. NKZ332]|nr:hypothetical protein FO519_009158 [Halicephalobus sp. NKZ332]